MYGMIRWRLNVIRMELTSDAKDVVHRLERKRLPARRPDEQWLGLREPSGRSEMELRSPYLFFRF